MSGAATATMLDAALDHARRGWPTFPLYSITGKRCTCGADCGNNAGKHPRIVDWPNQATTNPATIRQWWTRWPDANVGIATGEKSGFFVLDVDPRHGGDDTLRDLEAQNGPFPATVEALTGGGGVHKLYRYPGYPMKSGSGVLGPGLDIKGDGGYIVAPPSLHASGRHYVFEASSHPDDVAIADAPAWLLAMLTVKSSGNGHERFRVQERIRAGERNAALYRLARSLKLRELTEIEMLATLMTVNRERCEPPLDDAEVRWIAAHAFEQADRQEFTANSSGGAERKKPDDAALVRLADVQPEPVTWLWPGRIPLGKLTVLDGDPGV